MSIQAIQTQKVLSPALQKQIQPQVPVQSNGVESKQEDGKFTDVFEKIKNPPDMNDTINVPRIIFKGYLSFTVGTSLLSMASLAKKCKPLSYALTALGTLATTYGTYAFVKPYIIKEKNNKNKNAELINTSPALSK